MNSQRLYQWLCERLQRQPDHSDWPLGDLESQRAQLRPCDVLLVDGDSPLDRRLKVLTGSRFSRVLLYIGRPHEVADPALRSLLLINPPHAPHLPGLQALGLPPAALVWVAAATPAEALWAAEQAVKSRVAVLAWLPEARPEQVRRLQVNALGSDAPLFLIRPERAGQQSSAAPLRLVVKPGEGWRLDVHLLKRRGPAHAGWLKLAAVPGAVEPLLTAAKRKGPPAPAPTPARPPTERHDALARPVPQA